MRAAWNEQESDPYRQTSITVPDQPRPAVLGADGRPVERAIGFTRRWLPRSE